MKLKSSRPTIALSTSFFNNEIIHDGLWTSQTNVTNLVSSSCLKTTLVNPVCKLNFPPNFTDLHGSDIMQSYRPSDDVSCDKENAFMTTSRISLLLVNLSRLMLTPITAAIGRSDLFS
ncbi:uncharacterized protein PHALS_04477 [Plasmopara halstedii]|uniref:Uncharacterized protein n=1 Tax=Plasmopara halstedii TaxID=4781 RepID=A0A0P1A9E7_PLAHL|nr:uncharacterized protein PHALS_04477 [Plasmopara halstedii]CEG37012.1 hypothetical protein PHALS_04477 [Plasmopara halstedii]|eukprot:XP_024573381.1 hypothetical protein PHALS_04477 [Plasmopara halstedii]